MDVQFHSEAEVESGEVPAHERRALLHAVEKLRTLGTRLSFPHCSQVKGSIGLRELRPRAGRSPWRALYRRVGEVLVVAAIAPEAGVDPAGFARAVARAEARLRELEEHRGRNSEAI